VILNKTVANASSAVVVRMRFVPSHSEETLDDPPVLSANEVSAMSTLNSMVVRLTALRPVLQKREERREKREERREQDNAPESVGRFASVALLVCDV
jgi:predicted RNase H-like nuclease (RuvC/YqgF family)